MSEPMTRAVMFYRTAPKDMAAGPNLLEHSGQKLVYQVFNLAEGDSTPEGWFAAPEEAAEHARALSMGLAPGPGNPDTGQTAGQTVGQTVDAPATGQVQAEPQVSTTPPDTPPPNAPEPAADQAPLEVDTPSSNEAPAPKKKGK